MKNIGTALLLGIFGAFMFFTSNGGGLNSLNSLHTNKDLAAPQNMIRELTAPVSRMQATLIAAAASVTPAHAQPQHRSRSLEEMVIDEALKNSKETQAERIRNTMGQTYSK